jgi:hypothetical protein
MFDFLLPSIMIKSNLVKSAYFASTKFANFCTVKKNISNCWYKSLNLRTEIYFICQISSVYRSPAWLSIVFSIESGWSIKTFRNASHCWSTKALIGTRKTALNLFDIVDGDLGVWLAFWSAWIWKNFATIPAT